MYPSIPRLPTIIQAGRHIGHGQQLAAERLKAKAEAIAATAVPVFALRTRQQERAEDRAAGRYHARKLRRAS